MWTNLKRYFISGLIIFLPIALTIYLFVLAIQTADGLLGKFLEPYFYNNFGFYFHGLSILIGIYLIILIGFIATNFFGRTIHEIIEKIFNRLPFFRQVYPALKEMAIFLFSRDQYRKFNQVVIVEYPRKGVYSMGFLTSDSTSKICDLTKKDLCNVFLPSSPSPVTGFTVLIPRKDLITTDIKVEDAFKFFISGGVVNPQSLR